MSTSRPFWWVVSLGSMFSNLWPWNPETKKKLLWITRLWYIRSTWRWGSLSGSTKLPWYIWSEWTTCSVTCGRGGTKVRTRECLGQYSCVGRNVDWKTCDNIPCKGKMRKRWILIFVFTKFVILGKLSQWSGWSQCSTTCGKGTRHRQRTCIGPGDCDGLGLLKEEDTCPDQPKCHGTLDQWSSWSSCSATCGEATRKRQRECIGPGSCDGLGLLTEEEPCP